MSIEHIIILAIALSGSALFIGAVLAVLERRDKHFDDLEQFRRTIEAMRRIEQQDSDR